MARDTIIGFGLTILILFLQYRIKDMPHYITSGGIAFGLSLMIWPYLAFPARYNGPAFLFLILLAGMASAIAWAYEISQQPDQAALRTPTYEVVLSKLDANARHIIMSQNDVRLSDLTRQTFGPFPSGDGQYGDMPWPAVHRTMDRLLDLGVFKTADRGRFEWTTLGNSIVARLEQDGLIPTLQQYRSEGIALRNLTLNPNNKHNDVVELATNATNWSHRTFSWINAHVGKDAAMRFNDLGNGKAIPCPLSSDTNPETQRVCADARGFLTEWLKNLDVLIKSSPKARAL